MTGMTVLCVLKFACSNSGQQTRCVHRDTNVILLRAAIRLKWQYYMYVCLSGIKHACSNSGQQTHCVGRDTTWIDVSSFWSTTCSYLVNIMPWPANHAKMLQYACSIEWVSLVWATGYSGTSEQRTLWGQYKFSCFVLYRDVVLSSEVLNVCDL